MQTIYKTIENMTPQEMESVYFYIGDKLNTLNDEVSPEIKAILDARNDDYERGGNINWEDVKIRMEKMIYA